jgi:hypothetical protein
LGIIAGLPADKSTPSGGCRGPVPPSLTG